MMTSRIFNKILLEDFQNRTSKSITDVLEEGKKKIFSHHDDETETNDEDEHVDNFDSLIKENAFDSEAIKLISANRQTMELDTISKIIPVARGKYDSITSYIISNNRRIQFSSHGDKEIFVFSLAKKKSIVSTPNTLTKESLLAKGISTTSSTIAKNAINYIALGSFQMMANLLTTTFMSVVGIIVSLLSVLLIFAKKGGSRAFLRFSIILFSSQTVITVVSIVLTGLYLGVSYILYVGFGIIGFFWLVNQIGKLIMMYNEYKTTQKIEMMYNTKLYSKVYTSLDNRL